MMVEQNARRALAMSDRGYVLDLGKDRFEGPGQELLDDPKVAELYLGGDRSDVDRCRRTSCARRERPGPEAPAALGSRRQPGSLRLLGLLLGGNLLAERLERLVRHLVDVIDTDGGSPFSSRSISPDAPT